jgi:hypothetical protein
MNAPLSLYLTHFSAPSPSAPQLQMFEGAELSFEEPAELQPTITLTLEDLEQRLAAAASEALAAAEAEHAEALEAQRSQGQVDRIEALAAARADWAAMVSEHLGIQLETAFTTLRDELARSLAEALRPLIENEFFARAQTELVAALDRLLADPVAPAITVTGPADLCAKLRESRPSTNIDWIEADTIEISIATDTTHIETRFAEALSGIRPAGG